MSETATATDPRALIAEGRKHDEAMDREPWDYDNSTPAADSVNIRNIRGAECRCDDADDTVSLPAAVMCPRHECVAEWVTLPNAAGIAWLRTNLRALLDGYAAALDEVERLRAALFEVMP